MCNFVLAHGTCVFFVNSYSTKKYIELTKIKQEEKVKGHSGAIYRGPKGHNLNNFCRGPLDNVIYQIHCMKALGLLVSDEIFENCI